jgi:hypothetical protein
MPIAVPLEVQTDSNGVFTASEYLDNPLADWTLDAIKKGAIKAQSFSGRFMKSTKSRVNSRTLPTIRRMEVDMREYGPAVFAAYTGANILGTRSADMADMFVRSLLAVRPEDRLDWLQQFEGAVTLETPDSTTNLGTPTGPADSKTVDSQSRSTSNRTLAQKIRAERIKRGI